MRTGSARRHASRPGWMKSCTRHDRRVDGPRRVGYARETTARGGGMEMYLLWAVTGIVLIIVEMLTGTFFLLVLGIAALAAAAVAWSGQSFWVQAVTIAAVATVGVILVKRFRVPGKPASREALDVGQSV